MSRPAPPPESSPDRQPEETPPPPVDWVYDRAAPLLAIAMSAAFGIGWLLGLTKDVPTGLLGVITLLFGARAADRIARR